MCNAYNLKTNMASIGEATSKQLSFNLAFPPGVTAETSNVLVPQSVYPKRDGLALRLENGGLAPFVSHWGLIPFYHKGGPKLWKLATNNCRSETMATSGTFREAFKNRRCIIPATSFTEWTGPKGAKTAHKISRADGGMLFLAGLWDRCSTDDGPVENYTMVMMAAGGDDDMAPFHNRQPIVLEAASARTWLDPSQDPAPILTAHKGTLVADPPEPAAA